MFARLTQFAVIVVAGLSFGMGSALAADPPEATVQLDLQWLSPPQVTPEGGQAQAQQSPEYTRLQGAVVNQGSSFTWPLRYAIDTQRYPIMTLRYRARDLVPGPTYANKVMDVQLVDSGGRMTPLTVINLEDLVQDGAVHEIRKDLSQVPADAFIDQFRFNFQGGSTGGRLDLYGIVFDRGEKSPEPLKFVPQQVEFVVKDAAGNAVADAEVHLGLLERANWVALGSTDAAGKVTLTTLAQARPDGAVEPVEAVVERPGNLPQYVAPIKLPAGTPVEVKLSSMAQQPAATQPLVAQAQGTQPVVVSPQAVQPTETQEPAQVIYSTTVYNNTTYVPYPVYTYTYVEPYPVYWWVPVRYVRTRPVNWCDWDERWNHHHGGHIDVPHYDHPRPVVIPPPTRVPPPQRIPAPVRLDHGPGPTRVNGGWSAPRADGDRQRDADRVVSAPAPVVAPPPRLQTPPDLRGREERTRPGPSGEVSRPTNPPPAMSPGPGRITAPERPSRSDRGPAVVRVPDRSAAPQSPAPSPVAQDQPRQDAPRAMEPVRTPERREPPARVQRNDQDNQRPQAQRDETQRAAESQRQDAERQETQRQDAQRQAEAQRNAQRAADAQREAQRTTDERRADSQREEARREAARREEARREESRRVAQAPPPTANADGDPNNPNDPNSGAAPPARIGAPGRPSRR